MTSVFDKVTGDGSLKHPNSLWPEITVFTFFSISLDTFLFIHFFKCSVLDLSMLVLPLYTLFLYNLTYNCDL